MTWLTVKTPSARGRALFILAAALLLGAGCSILPGFGAPSPTPGIRAIKPPTRPTAVVKRGAIVESIRLLGRVAAVREAELAFKNAGRLKSIPVQPGKDVAMGQIVAELDTGDLEARIATAQVNYETAKLKLDQIKGNKADAELRRRLDLANAALVTQQAVAALAKAEADLAGAKAGPTPTETSQAGVRDAQTALDGARRNLATAQKSTTVAKNVRDRENEANWYEANYGNFLNKYNKGEVAKEELDRHWENLVAAKERLDIARLDSAAALARAEAEVAQAEDRLRKAQSDLDAKKALPPDWHIKQAEQAVDTAKLSLEKARLEQARKEAGGEDFEVTLQEKTVDQAKASLEELKAQLMDSRLTAPFAGKVMVARGKIGDQISALQPVANIADSGELQVRGDLIDADVPKVALGQEAAVVIDSLPGATLKGIVASVPGNFVSQGGTVQDRSVQIRIDWPKQSPQLGALARVSITVQKKDDVLLVPAKAVKTVGKRRFVEYMDGSIRRSANVEVGIATENEVEIVSGLSEGQVILSGG